MHPACIIMVKLTADLITSSPQFVNALGDREIDLRGVHLIGDGPANEMTN